MNDLSILKKHIGKIENISWVECDGRDILSSMNEARADQDKKWIKKIRMIKELMKNNK